jgi:protein TonB
LIAVALSGVFHAALLGWHLPETEALPRVNVQPGKSSIAIKLRNPSRPEPVEKRTQKKVEKPEPKPRPEPKQPERPESKQPALKEVEPTEQRSEEPVETKRPEPEKKTSQKAQAPSMAREGAEWVKKADYRTNPSPQYPEESREEGEEGTVVLRVHVDPEGKPTEVTVHESSGHDRLDRRARSTVSRWRFTPAEHADVTIRSTVLVPIRFRLN